MEDQLKSTKQFVAEQTQEREQVTVQLNVLQPSSQYLTVELNVAEGAHSPLVAATPGFTSQSPRIVTSRYTSFPS